MTSTLGYHATGRAFSHLAIQDGLQVPSVTVTQLTNQTTGVTATGFSGIVSMFAADLAAGAAAAFTVTNTGVRAEDVVLAQVINFAGTFGTGLPTAVTDNIANGSFDIVLQNADSGAGTGANAVTVFWMVLTS